MSRHFGKNEPDYSKQLENIKKQGSNKSCFDCGEKGTTYVVMNFGTFVCSRCAGILRELNFKVKGTGVTIFTEKDIELISKNGNDKAREIWMGKFKTKHDRLPDPKKYDDVKQHIIDKYKNKRFYVEDGDDKSDGEDEDDKEKDDSEEEKNKKSKKKKKDKQEKKKNENSNSGNQININKGKLKPLSMGGEGKVNTTAPNTGVFDFIDDDSSTSNKNVNAQFEFPTENNNNNNDWVNIWGGMPSETSNNSTITNSQNKSNQQMNNFDFANHPPKEQEKNQNNPFSFDFPQTTTNIQPNTQNQQNFFNFTNDNISNNTYVPQTQPQPQHPPIQTNLKTNLSDLEQALNDPSMINPQIHKLPKPEPPKVVTDQNQQSIPNNNMNFNMGQMNQPQLNQNDFMNNMKQMMAGNPQMMQMMNDPNMQNMMYQMMMNYMNMMNPGGMGMPNMNQMMNPNMGQMNGQIQNTLNPNINSQNQGTGNNAQPPKEEEQFDAFKDIYHFSQKQLGKNANNKSENAIPVQAQQTIPTNIQPQIPIQQTLVEPIQQPQPQIQQPISQMPQPSKPIQQPQAQSFNPFVDPPIDSNQNNNNPFQEGNNVKIEAQPIQAPINQTSINDKPKNINQVGEYNPFDFL